MQVKKKTKKEYKLLTLTWPVASCSFKPECQNSSSSDQELHKQFPALMQVKKRMKKINSTFLNLEVQLLAAASRQSVQIQALVNESFRFRPRP
jgi:hypothetical protein